MKQKVKYSQLGVKVAIGCGIILGLLLLIQTIATYFFVYDKVVHDQAYQEVQRKEAAIVKAAIAANLSDVHSISPVLNEVENDSPQELAWIRVITLDGQVVAKAGIPAISVPSSDELKQQLVLHQSRSRLIQSPKGEILTITSRFRYFRPPPSEAPGELHPPPSLPPFREQPYFTEVGVYVDSVTHQLGPLRQNLVLGCLASLALLTSMVMIGFLFSRYIRARQLEQQVELARSVQTDLLPSADARKSSAHLEFAAAFIPAAMVGGDFYDVHTSDDGRISIVLGDVAGKGISAALLMGVLHGAIRSMHSKFSAADQEQGSEWLNHFLCEKTARERFVSLFWANFTPETGELRYVNAGHLPPLLVHPTSVEKLDCGGPVLGVLPNATFTSGSIQVSAGDILIVFSDGVAEAANHDDQEFGETRIAKLAQEHLEESPQQICDQILSGVKMFMGNLKPHDDQTLMVVRLTPTPRSGEDSAFQVSSLQQLV